MPRVALAVIVLALLAGAVHWAATAPSARVARVMKTLGLAGLVAAGLWLLVTGRLAGLAAVAAGLAPWIIRALHLRALWHALRDRPGTQKTGRAKPAAGMTRDEAYQVLGLAPGATPDEIRAAHRRLMLGAHPDHGGSTWIAARLNQARDLLLTE